MVARWPVIGLVPKVKRPATDKFGKLPDSARKTGLHEGFKKIRQSSEVATTQNLMYLG